MSKNYQTIANKLLHQAGIEINGSKPYDLRVLDSRLFKRIFQEGSLGLGEAYLDGWWEADELDEFFNRVLRQRLDKRLMFSWPLIWRLAVSKVFNLQSPGQSFIVGKKHYDTGNDLFTAMLGKSLAYSCGYWANARDLDQAQFAKFDLICRKLGLKPGLTILDIGCGWGTFMKYAAENYGIKAMGITVSGEQAKLAKELCQGLPIEIKVQDYRKLDKKYDRVVSVGMFEHVGYKNYKNYMRVARRCLNNNGLFLLHTIGGNVSTTTTDPWMAKYIFPHSHLPSIKQISQSFEGLFTMEDWHNFGADYDKTLMAWHKNFLVAWPKLRNKYGERFYRMWQYYLLSCAGSFRSRKIQLWQIVLAKNGVTGGWKTVR